MSRTEFEILDARQERARDIETLPPSLENVYRLYLEITGRKFAPSWRDFRLDMLPAKIIPWAIIMDVIDGGADFKYRFYSAERSALRKKDYTGLMLTEYEPPVFRDKVMGEYRLVLESREPMVFTTTVSVPSTEADLPNEPRIYALLRMPLSSDGETIDRLFSVDATEYVKEWQYRFHPWQGRYTI